MCAEAGDAAQKALPTAWQAMPDDPVKPSAKQLKHKPRNHKPCNHKPPKHKCHKKTQATKDKRYYHHKKCHFLRSPSIA
jgi:hypothetical protein